MDTQKYLIHRVILGIVLPMSQQQPTPSECRCCQPNNLADMLIRDIRAVVPVASFIPTSELVAALIEHNPTQWSADNHYGRDLTAQRMGRLLANHHGIKSTRNHKDKRGYCASVFTSGGTE